MVVGVGLGANLEPLFPIATREITIATTAIAAAPNPPNNSHRGIPPLLDSDANGAPGGTRGGVGAEVVLLAVPVCWVGNSKSWRTSIVPVFEIMNCSKPGEPSNRPTGRKESLMS